MSERTLADRLGDLIDRADKLRAVESLAHPYAVGLMKEIEADLIRRLLNAKTDDERRELAVEARTVRALATWMEGIPRALKTAEDQLVKLKGRHPDAG